MSDKKQGSKPRHEKIEDILNAMDDWDLDTLLSWAKETRRDLLSISSDADIQMCWETECNEDKDEGS